MSASNEWTEWHLTPRGWERGKQKIDFAGTNELPGPNDAVLTMRWGEYLSSMYSSFERKHTEMWRSEDEENVSKLLEKYGEPPESL